MRSGFGRESGRGSDTVDVGAIAADGISGTGDALPHRVTIQASFGRHDVSGIRAHVGGRAQRASESMGAEAFATGSDVGFRGHPDLHTAAHEAAHVVQQRAGVQLSVGFGRAGDNYERHADAVADRVVRGESAEDLLDQHTGTRGGGTVQLARSWGRPEAGAIQFFKGGGAKAGGGGAAPKAGGGAAPKAGGGAKGAGDDAEAKRAAEEEEKLKKFKAKTYVWQIQYMNAVKARWSNQYVIKCVKKYWESLVARTRVNVVRDTSNPHYKLTIHKMPAGKYYSGSAISRWRGTGVPNAPGVHPKKWVGTLGGNLGSTDVTPQPDFNSPATRKTDAARMRKHAPKKILFAHNSAAIKGEYVQPLKDLGFMLSMTKHPVLTVSLTGRASTSGEKVYNKNLSLKRAENVATAIRSVGHNIVHTFKPVPQGEEGAGPGDEWRRVDIGIPDVPATFKNDYDIAGHEFGHQLGLHEDYPDPGSGVSAHYQLVEEAFGKKVAKTFTSREASSSSIMSDGLDVRPYHYVTFWEALGRVTSPTLTRADWKIQH